MTVPPVLGNVPFVGREQELAALTERLAATSRGRCGIVLLAGEPGIGKTRLMGELMQRAREAGWQILAGRASESEGTPPYLPFGEAFRDYVRARTVDELEALLGPSAPEVAIVAPELHRRLPDLRPAAGSPAEHARYHVYEAVIEFLLAIARSAGTGLLLCLDDLQWADRSSLILLQQLIRRLALDEAPLLVVGTYRTATIDHSHPLGDVLADVTREHVGDVLALRSFSGHETAALITAMAGAPPASQVVDAVHRDTGGNAFFLSELVRHLLVEGRNLGLPEALTAPWSVPEGVRHVIRVRLSRLGPETNRLLQSGAVLGEGFRHDVAAAVGEIDGRALMEALDQALSAGVLYEEGERYRFAHALIRQAIYGDMNRARRAALHRRALDALEHAAGSNPEPYLAELAHHAVECVGDGGVERAVAYASGAGDRALSLLAYEEAARFYRLALEALGRARQRDDGRRCELLLRMGDAQRQAGQLHAAMATFQAAAAQARVSGAAEALGRAALGFEDALRPWLWSGDSARATLARAAFDAQETPVTGGLRTGSTDPAILLPEEALQALGGEPSALRVRLLAAFARALYTPGALGRAMTISEEAVATARHLGDPAALAYALNARRTIVWGLQSVDEGVAVATELIRAADESGDGELALEGSYWRIRGLLELGEVSAADREIDAYRQRCELLRQPLFRPYAIGWGATRALLAGDFAEAERLAAEALSAIDLVQSRDSAIWFHILMLILRREQGRLEDLAGLEQMVVGWVRAYPDYEGWRIMLAWLYSELGRVAEAQEQLARVAQHDAADRNPSWVWLHHTSALAEVCACLGDGDRAATLYDLLLPYSGRNVADIGGCLGAASRYLGLLAATLGRREEARAHFEAALAFNARMGARPWVARTQCDYATYLLDCGESDGLDRARALLESALATYTDLGVERRVEQVRVLLGDRRLVAGSPGAARYPDRLTEREVEVLRLIAAGRTSREIAGDLVVSVRTVERHILNIYTKIGARAR